MNIPFPELPKQNSLFIDYIYQFVKLKNFFEYDYGSYEDFFKCIEFKKETFLTGKNFFRNDLTAILTRQNKDFDSGEKTFSNINLLNDNDTFAVVTGQQTGFLTGPLYTVIKALNVIRLSEMLGEKFKEFKFVPVFWMESDDHDFKEINNINFISGGNELINIEYLINGEEQEKYLKPSSEIIFDEHINSFTEKIESSLQNSDFKQMLVSKIRDFYSPGSNPVKAFACFMNFILGDRGLILLNPSDIEFKKLLKPVFEKELVTSPESCESVINTTDDLENSYDAQIKPKVINLFYIHEKNRYLLEPRENEVYALKHSRQKFTKEELFGLLDANPERFSWNVVTRPVCQDYLLPTIAYIGGPSEIAYFAQLKKVFKTFGDTMPVIYPRTSVTILEKRVKNFMEKFDVEFPELFDVKELTIKLLSKESEPDTETIFAEMKEKLTGIFYSFEKLLRNIDENQTDSFSKRNRQFIDSLNVAKEKFLNLQTKKNEVISSKLNMISANIFPDNNLQERMINVVYYLNKYGNELIDRLYENIRLDEFSHQLITPDSNPENSE